MSHIVMIAHPDDYDELKRMREILGVYFLEYSEFDGNAWFFDTREMSDTRKAILMHLGAVPVRPKTVSMNVIYTMMDVIEQVYFYDGEHHLELYDDIQAASKKPTNLIGDYYWFNTVETDWSLACDMLFYIVKKTA